EVLRCLDFWQAPGAGAAALEAASRAAAFAPGLGLPGRVWQSGAAAWIADVRRDDNFPRTAAAIASGLLAGFGSPIYFRGKVLGVIEFWGREGHPFDDDL